MKHIYLTMALLSISTICANADSNNIKSNIITNKITTINFNIKTKNNNPGNLRSVKTGKFRKFDTLNTGYLALVDDIHIKQSGRSSHMRATATLKQFVQVYAPKHENNTNLYIQILCNKLNITKDTPINKINTDSLVRYIIYIEDVKLYKQMYEANINP